MGQPERSASSTRRTPSTPTKPDSVGKPPRRAMRNSLSQRLSRLARIADLSLGRTFRAGLLGVAIAWRLANSWHRGLNSRAMSNDPQTRMDELDARADRSGYLALGGISLFFDTFRTLCSYSYSSSLTGISCMFLLDRWLLWCFGCVPFGCELWMGSFPTRHFLGLAESIFPISKGPKRA